MNSAPSTLTSPPLLRPSSHHRASTSDQSRLAPTDALTSPHHDRRRSPLGVYDDAAEAPASLRRKRDGTRGRSRSRRRKGPWKKLLWVKQPYPDNYTDEETFLDHLQRNPRLQPYEFWLLVAESTVIVQHVCSVLIFVCCFMLIFQERVSSVSVVSWGSVGTVLAWVLWDRWVGQEEAAAKERDEDPADEDEEVDGSVRSEIRNAEAPAEVGEAASTTALEKRLHGLGLVIPSTTRPAGVGHPETPSTASTRSAFSSPTSPSVQIPNRTNAATFAKYDPHAYSSPDSTLSPRNQQRLATAKSAVLIYCALLGLSPILKSLTVSTTPDSIWAMSSWLMCINVFSFDYGGGVGAKFPASLSTNAALMASTVLASRLPSTTHVFSLTLFSIEVFGLFPVFRRHVKHESWNGHILLTLALVVGASAGLAVTATSGGWTAAAVGVLLGCTLTGLAMGVCSWWLIDLQRYKNEISGPWDPARPVIRRGWD